MLRLDQVHPVTDFVRNYKSYLGRIKETGSPEVLTVNGKPEYVIIDAARFQAIEDELEQIRFVQAVNAGIEDMRAGRGSSLSETMAEIRRDLGL